MADKIYVDLETTGLDPRLGAEVRIISINGEAFDVWNEYHADEALQLLRENTYQTFVAHNAQFDLDFLAEWGYEHNGPIFDTMIAWQMLHAGVRDENNKRTPARLDYIVERLLGIELDKSFQKGPWDAGVDNQMLAYAAQDTEVLKDLHRELEAGIRKAGLSKMFTLEMQLLPILLQSKRQGIYIDRRAAERLVQAERDKATVLEMGLPDIPVGVVDAEIENQGSLFTIPVISKRARLNARSPSQVAQYFNLPDAQEDTLRHYVLEDGTDEHAQTVMDIKKHLKRASSVEKQILSRVAKDGRVHPTFHQCFTDTGRLSSREPNLQNQDRGKEVRSLFRPTRGKKFVIADYSQLELRLAAYYSGDEAMIGAYASGRDLHTETQRRIFGNPDSMDDEEKKKTRTLSKNINFGLVYGGGHGVLQRFAFKSGIVLPEDEAIEYRHAFREAYPGLVEWQGKEGNTNPPYVYTHLGRRRYIKPGEGFNARINNKIQGTAGDGMKLAMVYLWRNHGILPLLNIHDEIVCEIDNADVDNVAELLPLVMTDAMYRATGMDKDNPKVPIEAEVDIGTSWADKS
jgi:DNA polymerase I-like protein with 3'-5' exonuclease and polymerase domains